MTTERFDAIVIGTGQAGPALAVRLAGSGRKTAILERKLVGGTCVNNGCIPTKTLIASAPYAALRRALHMYAIAEELTPISAWRDRAVAVTNLGASARRTRHNPPR